MMIGANWFVDRVICMLQVNIVGDDDGSTEVEPLMKNLHVNLIVTLLCKNELEKTSKPVTIFALPCQKYFHEALFFIVV